MATVNTSTDPRARLAQAEAAISEVDQHEETLRREAEQRRAKKAQALAAKKALLPEILRADIATEKDALAAIHDSNKKASQAAQAKLQTAAAALDKALGDVRNALADVERTHAQHDEYARHIHGLAYEGFETIIELDRPDYIQSRGEQMAQLEIERVIKAQYGQFVGRIPAADSPIVTLLLAIQTTKNPAHRRLLQAIAWAVSGSPGNTVPDVATDWTPPAEYQRERG